jgi:hypothetical protein
MPLGRIIYVPGASSALTNQPNVNYKWKIFIFVERAVMVIMMMGALWAHTEKAREGRNGMAFIMQNFCVIDWHEWNILVIFIELKCMP